MKNYKFYSSILIVLLIAAFIYGCHKEKKSIGSNITPSPKASVDNLLKNVNLAYRDSGWAYVKRENNKIIIYQKNNGIAECTFNKLIVLALDNPSLNFVSKDLPNDSLYFWYSQSKRQIVTYSFKSNKILILALNDSAGVAFVNKFKNAKINNVPVEYALGYGLSVVHKQYPVSDFLQRDLSGNLSYKTPKYISNIDLAALTPDEVDPGGGGMSCTSGGTGSSQCSVGNGDLSGGNSCSVTCNTGYYACCNDDQVICKCYANPKKPD
jgi:hypothetical protein